jgi:hypothetical protein
LRDFKTWAEQGAPPRDRSTIIRRGMPDQVLSIAAAPAPTKMIAHRTQQGRSIDLTTGWAASELDGFMRG